MKGEICVNGGELRVLLVRTNKGGRVALFGGRCRWAVREAELVKGFFGGEIFFIFFVDELYKCTI